MDASEFARVESVLGILLRELCEKAASLIGMIVAEGGDGKHHAGEGCEVMTLGCGEAEETDALLAVGGRAGHAEDPADRRGFEAEHVVLDARGEIGVEAGGVNDEDALGEGAGFLTIVKGRDVALVDHEGVVGAHAGDEGFDVEGGGVVGVALEGLVGEGAGFGGLVVEVLADGGVGCEALAVVEAGLVSEELDVNDVEAIELAEEPGGCVGDGAHGVLGMVVHPLLELEVGLEELQVVHIVVAGIERSIAQGCGCRESEREQKKNQDKKECMDAHEGLAVTGGDYRHSFMTSSGLPLGWTAQWRKEACQCRLHGEMQVQDRKTRSVLECKLMHVTGLRYLQTIEIAYGYFGCLVALYREQESVEVAGNRRR